MKKSPHHNGEKPEEVKAEANTQRTISVQIAYSPLGRANYKCTSSRRDSDYPIGVNPNVSHTVQPRKKADAHHRDGPRGILG
jgi:hypothetical protein